MIPYIKLDLTARHADVLNGGLPTEKHGDEKKAFFDLKIETLLELEEIDRFLATPGDDRPSAHIFDLSVDGGLLNMPDVDITAKLREDIRGDLVLRIGTQELVFGDAHTVGTANRLTFMIGGKGRLVMQFRLDPGADEFQALVGAVERGECSLSFTEYEESAGKKRDDKQDEMSV